MAHRTPVPVVIPLLINRNVRAAAWPESFPSNDR